MTIIRDEQLNGLMMIPAFQKFNITRCNVSGCTQKPSTIIKDCVADNGDAVDFALCEHHYKESKEKGRIEYRLDFDTASTNEKE
jgi:hypothetical protein